MAGLRFNALLADASIDPRHVRLLRHETQRHGRTPYALWRDDRAAFESYQSIQKRERRSWFDRPIWASFVVAPGGITLFAGLYDAQPDGRVPPGWTDPISGRTTETLTGYELYRTALHDALNDYVGRLAIDWGSGTRSWSQRADQQDKPIVELRETFVEPSFPGYALFEARLSEIENLPSEWRGALAAARGVYLLTCPRTREQYVGSATGERGFLGRWMCYVRDTHGGNVALKSREPEDYHVGILQVAGSADREADVLALEALWKRKLQSREMGLNRN